MFEEMDKLADVKKKTQEDRDRIFGYFSEFLKKHRVIEGHSGEDLENPSVMETLKELIKTKTAFKSGGHFLHTKNMIFNSEAILETRTKMLDMMDEQKKVNEDNKVAEKEVMMKEALSSYERYNKKTDKGRVNLADYKAILKFCLHIIPEETKPISHYKTKAEIVSKLEEINWESHLILLVQQRSQTEKNLEENTPPPAQEEGTVGTATIETNSEQVEEETM